MLGKIFKKKEKEKSNETQDNSQRVLKKGEYEIVILESLGGLPREIKTFVAKRFVDVNFIPYLWYEDPKTKDVWMEVFPDKVSNYVTEKKEVIEKKLQKVRERLKTEKEKEEPTVNFRDLEFEILQYEAQLRTFDYNRNASFEYLDINNNPKFYFLRKGTNYLPFVWDLDSSKVLIPTNAVKQMASISLRNKEAKHQQEIPMWHKIASMLFLAITLIAAGGTGWMFYKSVDQYSESEINQAIEACMSNYAGVVGQTQQQAQSITKIVDSLEDELEKTRELGNNTQRNTQSFE